MISIPPFPQPPTREQVVSQLYVKGHGQATRRISRARRTRHIPQRASLQHHRPLSFPILHPLLPQYWSRISKNSLDCHIPETTITTCVLPFEPKNYKTYLPSSYRTSLHRGAYVHQIPNPLTKNQRDTSKNKSPEVGKVKLVTVNESNTRA